MRKLLESQLRWGVAESEFANWTCLQDEIGLEHRAGRTSQVSKGSLNSQCLPRRMMLGPIGEDAGLSRSCNLHSCPQGVSSRISRLTDLQS